MRRIAVFQRKPLAERLERLVAKELEEARRERDLAPIVGALE